MTAPSARAATMISCPIRLVLATFEPEALGVLPEPEQLDDARPAAPRARQVEPGCDASGLSMCRTCLMGKPPSFSAKPNLSHRMGLKVRVLLFAVEQLQRHSDGTVLVAQPDAVQQFAMP